MAITIKVVPDFSAFTQPTAGELAAAVGCVNGSPRLKPGDFKLS